PSPPPSTPSSLAPPRAISPPCEPSPNRARDFSGRPFWKLLLNGVPQAELPIERKLECCGEDPNKSDRAHSGIGESRRCQFVAHVEPSGSNSATRLAILVFPPEKTAPRVTTSGWTSARS